MLAIKQSAIEIALISGILLPKVGTKRALSSWGHEHIRNAKWFTLTIGAATCRSKKYVFVVACFVLTKYWEKRTSSFLGKLNQGSVNICRGICGCNNDSTDGMKWPIGWEGKSMDRLTGLRFLCCIDGMGEPVIWNPSSLQFHGGVPALPHGLIPVHCVWPWEFAVAGRTVHGKSVCGVRVNFSILRDCQCDWEWMVTVLLRF